MFKLSQSQSTLILPGTNAVPSRQEEMFASVLLEAPNRSLYSIYPAFGDGIYSTGMIAWHVAALFP